MVVDADQVPSIAQVVRRRGESRPTLNGPLRHIKVPSVGGQFDGLAMVNHHGVVVSISFFIFDHASEDEDLLTGDLGSSRVYNPQLLVVANIVDSFPLVVLDVEGFNFLHEVKVHGASNASLRAQALSSDYKEVFVVELTDAESLSGFLKLR